MGLWHMIGPQTWADPDQQKGEQLKKQHHDFRARNEASQIKINCIKKKSAYACWQPASHAYLPMRFKYRKCSKPSCCGLLFRPDITPSINRASTVFPTCSLYNFCKIWPVIIRLVMSSNLSMNICKCVG